MSTIKKYYRICLFGALLLLFSTGLFAEDRAVPTTYSAFLDAVNVPYAWNLGFTGAKAIVGIIDDSSDRNHPFFGSNIDTSLAFNTGVIYNDESYRQIYPDLPTQSANDTSAVWDRAVVRKDETLQPYNDYGDFHGTNVTGCIASYDTTTNTYGPAYGATLVPIRVDFPCQDFDVYMPDGTRISKYTTVQAIKYRNDVIDVKNNSYGSAAGAECKGSFVSANPYLKFYFEDDDNVYTVQSNLIGAYNFDNAMAAVCVGRYFGVELFDIKTAIEEYMPSNNRSQYKETGRNALILDCYNANPSSMRVAVENFVQMKSDNKVVVLGGMKELGSDSKAEHKSLYDMLRKAELKQIILVGDEFKFASSENNVLWFPSVTEAKEHLVSNPISGATILLKGSNSNKMWLLEEVL